MSLYQVNSSQTQVHDQLALIVTKHQKTHYQKPVPDRQYQLFKQAQSWFEQQNRPILLDVGCGVGRSSVLLAKHYPDYAVVGIDKSLKRLQRNVYYRDGLLDNLLLLPANCIDFWRLAVEEELPIVKQYILYPNPYPKTSDVTKRWHGHPIFPWLMAANSTIELRSNWVVYLQEFAKAAQIVKPDIRCQWQDISYHKESLTHFECKYQQAGESIYQLILF